MLYRYESYQILVTTYGELLSRYGEWRIAIFVVIDPFHLPAQLSVSFYVAVFQILPCLSVNKLNAEF